MGIPATPLGQAPACVPSFEWLTGYNCLLEFLHIVWEEKGINNLVSTGGNRSPSSFASSR